MEAAYLVDLWERRTPNAHHRRAQGRGAIGKSGGPPASPTARAVFLPPLENFAGTRRSGGPFSLCLSPKAGSPKLPKPAHVRGKTRAVVWAIKAWTFWPPPPPGRSPRVGSQKTELCRVTIYEGGTSRVWRPAPDRYPPPPPRGKSPSKKNEAGSSQVAQRRGNFPPAPPYRGPGGERKDP